VRRTNPLPIAHQAITARRRSLAGWTVGIAGMVILIAAIYPTVRDSPEFKQLLDKYPKELLAFVGGTGDMTTPAGYLRVELFSFMLPLLFMIMAIGAGASTLADEELHGTLALVVARPVSRRRVVVEKALAILHPIGVLSVVLYTLLLLSGPVIGVHLSLANAGAATFDVLVLAVLFGSISLAIGAISGRRGTAIGITAAIAVASYLVDALANLVSWMRAGRRLSPISHTLSLDPLRTGFHLVHSFGLLAVAVLAVWIGAECFDRRDLGR
jgi:ABC-2 type transport system permease protein